MRGSGRSRLLAVCVMLLLSAFLTGATTLGTPSPGGMDLAKVVAVVAFIGSMVALAFGMIGDAYYP